MMSASKGESREGRWRPGRSIGTVPDAPGPHDGQDEREVTTVLGTVGASGFYEIMGEEEAMENRGLGEFRESVAVATDASGGFGVAIVRAPSNAEGPVAADRYPRAGTR